MNLSCDSKNSRDNTNQNKKFLSILILTYNSANTIERTLDAAFQIAEEIHVVDSFSADGTVSICDRRGCIVTTRKFSNYADQRNWAIDNLPISADWQMHLDADEELEPELIGEINKIDLTTSIYDGYMLRRKTIFMNKYLRFGSVSNSWHYRLFRSGFGRCEDRLYDQHFLSLGRTGKLNGSIIDHQSMSLSEWTLRHNRWSDLEAREAGEQILHSNKRVSAKYDGTAIERRRYYKSMYYASPLFIRAVLYFIYRYFILLGFLDGMPGLIYHSLQGFWFRFLVDAKIYESKRLNPLEEK